MIRGVFKARMRAKMGEREEATPRLRFSLHQLELGDMNMVRTLDSIFKCGKQEVEIGICGTLSRKTLCSSILDREHFYSSEAWVKYIASGHS